MSNANFRARALRVRLVWIGVVAAAAAAVLWGMWPRPFEVDLVTLDAGPLRSELVDEGRTRLHDVYVISAPVGGRMLRIDVEPGDNVRQGEIIARMTQAAAGFLDPRSDLAARAAVDAAAAALRAADSDLALARREHERNRSIADRQLISQSALDISQARLDAAQAARDAANADLARARSALQPALQQAGGDIAIRAPAAGSVLRVLQESENVVPAGSPLVEIGDRAHVEVVAEFLSQDAVRMRPGQSAVIENWGGEPLAATVDRIEPVARLKISALGVEEQRTNVLLQFADQAAASALGHEFRVDVRVTVADAGTVLRVPLGALFRHEGGWAVYRVLGGHTELVEVGTGMADNNFREVTGGLSAGDQVVLFPGDAVREGMQVIQRRTD